jgi:hypothetical protein
VIRKAVDEPKGEYLALDFDIVEGKYKGYAAETAERAGFWPLNCRRYYGGKSIGFFKAFIEAVQNTNKNYKWNWDESTLVGKGEDLDDVPITLDAWGALLKMNGNDIGR